ncbi:MAG: hypothetical protein QM783_12455 [Phycisphaerales bacterium]
MKLTLALLTAATFTTPAFADGYAVLVSKQTAADPQWSKVVQALVKKHQAQTITYEGDIDSAKSSLAAQMPIYTAIVAKPEELGRGFVAKTHRMMRRLDDDPYTDTIWGIVTGFTPADALTLVSDDKPLVMKRVVSTTGVNGGLFDQMFTVSDGAEGQWTFKNGDKTSNGGTKDDNDRKYDRAVLFAQHFKQINPDVIVSSSHGFENGIEMPWGHGMLIGRNGELAILPQNPPGKDGSPGKGLGKPVKLDQSTNPKVFLPVGNCLVGHIDAKHTKDSLILALQHTAAVRQSIGYTIETWYGRGGWGTLGLLQSQPGQLTVAQAWFFNHQQLLEDLRTKHAKAASFDYEWTDKSSVESFMREAQKSGISGQNKDEMGLAFDRDVVALYGDPAYDARLDASKWTAPVTATLDESSDERSITLKLNDDKYHGPLMLTFTKRCPSPKSAADLPAGTILTDNFIIIPDVRNAAGERGAATIRFRSENAAAPKPTAG